MTSEAMRKPRSTRENATGRQNFPPRERLIHFLLAEAKNRRDWPAGSPNGGYEMMEHLILLPLIMLLIKMKIKIRIIVKKKR